MSDSLGLSIGVANLVAARAGGNPVPRSSVLTLFGRRPAEVGLPEENPNLNEPGLVLRGFVERVGDQAPLVATDGTKYQGAALTVVALDAMARTVGYGAPVTIAAPAYWSQGQFTALREALVTQPSLAPDGAPMVISDATVALAGLATQRGFPTGGVVALCDFGAGGTSVTLAHAGANLQQIGATVRYPEFSGDEIDQAILNHVLTVAPGVDSSNVSVTATQMGSVTRLLGACRRAKEQLSAGTVATIATGASGLPGSGADLRVSRAEFDQLISGPLDRFLAAFEEVLQRNGIARNSLGAVAIVGGGASIPLITTRLAQRFQVPVLTGAQPLFGAAVGATSLGLERSSAGLPTGAGPAVDVPTSIVGAASPPTQAAPTAWAPAAGATEALPGSGESTTDQALAWSEDAGTGLEPVPYAGPADYTSPAEPAPVPAYTGTQHDLYPGEPEVPQWYRRPAILLSLAGAAAAILLAVVLALTLRPTNTKPVTTTSQPPPITTTVIGPDNSPTQTVITPPPVTVTTTTTRPPVTTTTTPPPSSTSTTSTTPSTTTTTTTTTTTPPPTTTTTTPPPTTSTQVTTTAPPTTTVNPPPTTTVAPVTPTTVAPGA